MRQPLAAWFAALLSFLALYALGLPLHAGAGPAILATVIALGLVRRPTPGERVHLLVEAGGLVLVAVAAGLVGLMLRWNLPIGGTVFAAAVACSIWMRGRGDDARAIGAAVALPFVAILVVPVGYVPADARWLLLVAPLVALALATAARRLLEPDRHGAPAEPREPSTRVPSVHARMGLQMFVALALAFAIGALVVRAHWPWIVLSALIVCGGALGRLDALYKGVLRLLGALGGGALSAIALAAIPANGVAQTLLAFAALLAGLALRPRSYAYWAASTTLIFAILARTEGALDLSLYLARLGCIVIGALCGIAASSLVFPLRTSDIARRRIALALVAIEGTYGASESAHATLHAHANALERIEGALRFHRIIARRSNDDEHPAAWLERTRLLCVTPYALGERSALARAVGRARRAVRDREDISAALDGVRSTLEGEA